MDIFLLRHAETESNKKGLLSSCSADPLTNKGVKQSLDIVGCLEKLGVQSILCSPYLRAQKTIEPFSKASGIGIETHGSLAEGQLVLGTLVKPLNPIYNESSGYPILDETKEQFVGRAIHAAELILSQKHERILVVSHGHMIRELLNIFIKPAEKMRFPHANCGLTRLSVGDNQMIHYINREISL
ncbi:histidine phosphatase family protein [Vibrio sp. SCSIO 43136]|uniref:histidine phosphatase family protein n=1 Tax=Vibrio sp. SCSIO 43136 TaxID=2819101 RepID=UPI002075561A|nr:histidine phosphatase family protein [Vibrio sp. SCSIO 43136]USD66839.1 histidine phosphatase family protein [Vibrio sp. SCSIO 43136]